jgi:hypothetical protein
MASASYRYRGPRPHPWVPVLLFVPSSGSLVRLPLVRFVVRRCRSGRVRLSSISPIRMIGHFLLVVLESISPSCAVCDSHLSGSVVYLVITSASHAEGREFDPLPSHHRTILLQFFISIYGTLRSRLYTTSWQARERCKSFSALRRHTAWNLFRRSC